MRRISEAEGLKRLQRLKDRFSQAIRNEYEHRARSCATCETPGACCLDAHFVNVHITRLEAIAIRNVLAAMPQRNRDEIYQRIENAITTYGLLAGGDTFEKTFACPIFEKGVGCLVHEYGKPLPCIAHACYEMKEDLPPDDLLTEQEVSVAKLNEYVYRRPATSLPLPVAVALAADL